MQACLSARSLNTISCESYIIVGFVCFYCTIIGIAYTEFIFCLVLDFCIIIDGLGSRLMGDRDRVKCSGSGFVWSLNMPLQWNVFIHFNIGRFIFLLFILFLFCLVMIEMIMVSVDCIVIKFSLYILFVSTVKYIFFKLNTFKTKACAYY